MKTVLIAALLVLFFLGIAPAFTLSYILYVALLVRTKPSKWGRSISIPDDAELVKIYEDAAKFDAENASYKEETVIENEGFRLVGEYFDFGNDKAAIIIPGRLESLNYSKHFAYPYKKAGYNVLVIDNRSHGLSDGRYDSLGYKEYKDTLKWAEYLYTVKNNKSIVIHGVCIGSSNALFTLTSENCPEYISGMVADGMYKNFYETYKHHMIDQNRPLFPVLQLSMFWIWVFTGARTIKDGPFKQIGKLDKPILFIHSKKDVYSLPEEAKKLYASCRSENKKIVWFETGAHSRIRIVHSEEYDNAIVDFLSTVN